MRGCVTISRSYGAGGIRVADTLSRALGWTKVDRELAEQAALRIGVDPELAEALDERVPDLLDEAGLALAAAEMPMGVPSAVLEDRPLAEAVGAVIRSLADTGRYVILGRGGQAALRERDDVVHLQLVADLADRARRISQWQGIDEREAAERCRQVDERRAAYVRRFYGVDIADPLLYDAVFNTSRLGIEGTARAALGIVRRRFEEGEE